MRIEDGRKKNQRGTHDRPLNSLWLILSALFLALTVGLAAVISHRFLSTGLEVVSVAAAVSLALLSLSVGSTLTETGWQSLQSGLSRWGIHLNAKSKWQLVFTITATFIACFFYFSLPALARVNNTRAVHLQHSGDLSAAIISRVMSGP